jgi:predicted nucleic acid-binding protein
MSVLIDTSTLLAYAFVRDANHEQASEALKTLSRRVCLVPAPVITELFYMTMVRVNYMRAIEIFAATRAAFDIVDLTEHDMARMQDIMLQYKDARFDYTDTALMALSERLNITQICTFDHRDFSIYRPQHCEYLQLLP